jgi:hypothetical protein
LSALSLGSRGRDSSGSNGHLNFRLYPVGHSKWCREIAVCYAANQMLPAVPNSFFEKPPLGQNPARLVADIALGFRTSCTPITPLRACCQKRIDVVLEPKVHAHGRGPDLSGRVSSRRCVETTQGAQKRVPKNPAEKKCFSAAFRQLFGRLFGRLQEDFAKALFHVDLTTAAMCLCFSGGPCGL